MKTPNFKDKQGKHPIPHAKGIAKEETRENDSIPKTVVYRDKEKQEEE